MKQFHEWLKERDPQFDEGWRSSVGAGLLSMASLFGGGGDAHAQDMPTMPKMYKQADQINLQSGSYKSTSGKSFDLSIKEIGENYVEVPVIVDAETKKSDFKRAFKNANDVGERRAVSTLAKCLGRDQMSCSMVSLNRTVDVPEDGIQIHYYRIKINSEKAEKAEKAEKSPASRPSLDKTIPSKKIVIDD
jgi:hypothetical protein